MYAKICKVLIAISIFIIFCGFKFDTDLEQNSWDFYNFDKILEDIPKYKALLPQDFEFDFKPIENLGYIFSLPHEAAIGRRYYHIEQNPDINLDIAICDSYESTYSILKDSMVWRKAEVDAQTVNKIVGDVAFTDGNWLLFIRANVFVMVSDKNEDCTGALKIAQELDTQIIEKLDLHTGFKIDFKIITAICLSIILFLFAKTKIKN